MRLSGAGDAGAAAALIEHALETGVTSFHCSSEYETYPLFCEAWRQVPSSARAGATIVAKVASPHFGENHFSAAAFRSKTEAYCEALSIERLGVVQWLLRHDLKQEEARLRILRESAEEVAATVAELKREGLIGAFVGFPYTPGVGAELLAAPHCDGLALYVNPLEREMDHLVTAAADARKSVLAIRPLAAGRLFAETQLTAADALNHVFGFPAVATAVVSASSPAHLDELTAHAAAASAAGR
jgi:aryl-alcohol dehydrogenase-like predicted oxidoreductase